ncbi:hypothetical protein AB0M48_30040 [Lentzea sp. NPDC051208]|uniref:glycoside hydrolase family 16 protein n=1 Tax=Lentzea sp. NPDC051208 TaxID=3154642 RepID=UPI003431E118
MFTIAAVTAGALAPATAAAQPPVAPPEISSLYSSTPTYADEFNDSTVNANDWYYRITGPYRGGYMTSSAVSESGGALRFSYSKRDVNGDGVQDFVSGGVISRKLFGYGYYEVRARLYSGSAPLHTSFWSMGLRRNMTGAGGDTRINDDIDASQLPENNQLFEIDGFEHNSPDRLDHGNYPQSEGTIMKRSGYKTGAEREVNYADWNVYGYEYTPQEIKFFINGDLSFTIDNVATNYQYAPMNHWLTALPYDPVAGTTVAAGSSDFDYFRFYSRPLKGTNLLGNPSFDALPKTNPGAWIVPGWIESYDKPASMIATDDVVDGSRSLKHSSTSAYTVTTKQNLTFIPNGTYTLTAKVKSSGGQTQAMARVMGYGGVERTVAIPATNTWTQVTIPNVNVTNGSATVAFTSNAAANQWLRVDQASFVLN